MTVHEFLREHIEAIDLDWLYARCSEIDGCLVWKRSASHGSDPQATLGGRAGGTILVRRALWELVNERPFPRNRVARCSCGTDLCVHPDHVIAVKKADLQRGKPLPLSHRAQIAKTKRAQSKLTQANVAYIRRTEGPLEDVANEFGIDPSYVGMIRLGKVRIDYANPFVGLGAR